MLVALVIAGLAILEGTVEYSRSDKERDSTVRVTFDPDADAAYIYLTEIAPGEARRTERLPDEITPHSMVMIDFGEDGRMLGIEVIGARAFLPEDLLAQATLPGNSPN